tara:strand:- start:1998 stop:2189 length:192 start_codon:yes stop_codon:yes gene_type:complete
MTSPMLSKQVDLSEGLEKAVWDILYSEAMYTGLDLEDKETIETIVKVLHKIGHDLATSEEAGE